VTPSINTIVFDLGGVLIDWNPRYLYRKIFDDEEKVSWFLNNICTSEWNEKQDRGRPFGEATEMLLERYPDWETLIRAWYDRWHETISGPIPGTVDVLRRLKNQGSHRLLALTNWSAETFPWTLAHFEFLHWFEGIVVSGTEQVCKPDPRIYNILLERYALTPEQSLFIDDNLANVTVARSVGLQVHHFQSAADLSQALTEMEVF
jgi:2-haloacid dehalogenase